MKAQSDRKLRPSCRMMLLLAGLGLIASSAHASGQGGRGDDSYAGGSGTASGTLGNGGTGGNSAVAGNAGSDASGNAVAGGAVGVATDTATGTVDASGGVGATGQVAAASGSLGSAGTIAGGGGGGGGRQDINSGSAAAVGNDSFTAGSINGGNGGIGLQLPAASLAYTSAGAITGGGGGGGGHNSFYMSNGAYVASAGSTNGGAGGTAVSLAGNAASFSNSGTVSGGSGGGGGTSYALANSLTGTGSVVSAGSANGGAGGTGVDASASGAVIGNSGQISGGNGGNGGMSAAYGTYASNSTALGGAGGVGVALAGGNAVLDNTGSISGGQGGAAGVSGTSTTAGIGAVGVAVTSDGNTIINGGSIGGGLPGSGVASAQAEAVSITGNNNTVQLGAAYSFTGNVVVHAGSGNVLALGGSAGGSFDVGSIVSVLPVAYSGTTQFYGFSSFAKTGASTWMLTGSNSAVSAWSVGGGTLLANATQANTLFTVTSGGTLDGTGSIGAVNVNSGAILAASTLGDGLSIHGDLALGNGATYRVAVDSSGAAGLVRVNGNLVIGATAGLQLVASAGSYSAGTRYLIASYTGSRSGTFGSVTHNFAYLTPSVSYDSGSVSVLLNPSASFQASGFNAAATTNNQRAAAAALTRINTDGGSSFTQALMTASSSQAGTALKSASGDSATAAAQDASASIQYAQQAIGQRLAVLDGRRGGPVIDEDPWISLSVTRQHRATGDDGASAYDSNGSIVSFGHDQALTADWLVGFSVSASNDRTSYRDVAAEGRSDGLQGSVYARYRPQDSAWFFKGMAGLGWWSNTLDRQVVMGSFASSVHGKYALRSTSLYGEAGYALALPGMVVEPYAGWSAILTWRPSYSESTQGGSDGVALSYASQRTTQTAAVFGVRLLEAPAEAGAAASLQWQADLAWRHALGSNDNVVQASFVGNAGDNFTVHGSAGGRDQLLLQAGLSRAIAPTAALFGKVGATLGQGYQSYGVQVGLRWWW
ncbi:autotransporter domain-containing protein [Herbaspirillum sp. NPDC087042]|uniref:autotransporter outer membrane beta-barrel domain-containing protein n=1 Tax=Herbaspirillum sp. NPDC087042 TaxID=3364004 RepID=UPI00382B0AFF